MTEFSSTNQPAHEKKANGAKTRKIMTDALMVALNREVKDIIGEDGKPTKKLTLIADQLVDKATCGDIQAIKEIFDRTEGKAAQALSLSNPDGGPLTVQLVRFTEKGDANPDQNGDTLEDEQGNSTG